MKKCKNCKQNFEQVKFNQQYCFEPDCMKVWIETAKEKQWQKKKAKMKSNLQTTTDLLKIAQQVFNKYIRQRDANKLCISCDKIPKKPNAGHYFSQGGHSALRFNEDNVHLQCEHCNSFLSGNLINYQIGINKRIGGERLMKLYETAWNEKKWTKEELLEIISKYKKKSI